MAGFGLKRENKEQSGTPSFNLCGLPCNDTLHTLAGG
jgi:hypothetical protein